MSKTGNKETQKFTLKWPLCRYLNLRGSLCFAAFDQRSPKSEFIMKDLISNEQKTMTLKEITDLLEVRHDKACKKVLSMAEDPEFGTVSVMDIVYNDKGQKISTYILNERQSIAVASRLNTALLMRVIDRWKALESKERQFQIPQTMGEALQLAADQAKQLELQAPMIEVYDKLANRKNDVSTTTLAKQLGVSAIKLNRWLRAKGYKCLFKDYPAANYAHWFNVVSDISGTGHEFTQCLITPKGQIEIAKRWEKCN